MASWVRIPRRKSKCSYGSNPIVTPETPQHELEQAIIPFGCVSGKPTPAVTQRQEQRQHRPRVPERNRRIRVERDRRRLGQVLQQRIGDQRRVELAPGCLGRAQQLGRDSFRCAQTH